MFQKTRLTTAVGVALAATLACGAATAGRIQFNAVPFAETDAEKREMTGSDEAKVNSSYEAIGFQTLLRSGDELPLLGGAPGEMATYGMLVDQNGDTVMVGGEPAISNDNDFQSILQADGKIFLVSHFESRPAAVYVTELEQDGNGFLSAVATRPADFSGVNGGFVHCAGSVSPWGTHMGSEEYEPDARSWVDPGLDISDYNAAQSRYFGGDGTPASAAALLNPYHYGWPWELSVDNADGDSTVTKLYATARLAIELPYVMPDKKTVYITDDGTNTLLAMFVADRAGDLSAGTLYAAKWNQLAGNEAKGGRANLEWVNLGHATSTEIEAYLGGTTFADIFDFEEPVGGACPTLTSINSGHSSPYHECLSVKPGMEQAASRLETRRYAALMGATTEFRKMEGITYNPDQRKLYLAMSEVSKGMQTAAEDASRHEGGNDHIQVPKNNCGAVYSMSVGGIVYDTDGSRIRSSYAARNMIGLVAGEPISGDANNSCALDGIANPDNVTYLPRYRTLVIGEDTGSGHQNDVVWSYDLLRGTLTRILTTPYGSETTSPYWYPDVNGFGYLTAVAQHPYGESDQDKLIPGSGDERAYTGYVGPFPRLK